jgi:hypothetical protein
MPILNCLINHKNSEIAQKIYELHSLIKQRTIEELFENNDIQKERLFHSLNGIYKSNNSNEQDDESSTVQDKRLVRRYKNSQSTKSNLNNKLQNKKCNRSYSDVFDMDEKNKFEDLKNQIIIEISENKSSHTKRDNLLSNEINKGTLNSLRNLSTKSNKNKGNFNRESIENFEKISFDLNSNKMSVVEKLKTAKILNYPIKQLSNESITGLKSAFYNKEENKRTGVKEFSNYENMSFIENINNNCFSESYNLDSSMISAKENTSNRTKISGINRHLRKNSSIDNKDKLFSKVPYRQNSINSKKSKEYYN